MYSQLLVLATAAMASAQTYTASFTEYGSTDNNGSGNCNTATTACGFYTYVSQPLPIHLSLHLPTNLFSHPPTHHSKHLPQILDPPRPTLTLHTSLATPFKPTNVQPSSDENQTKTARLLSRRIAKRIRRRPRRRRRPGLRHMLETDGGNRQQRQRLVQRRKQHRRTSDEPVSRGREPVVCSERTDWYQSIWC